MKRTNALQDLLEDMTAVFNDGEALDVEFDDSSYAEPDGTVVVAPNVRETLGRNLDGPQELRCLIDTLSHEVEHVRESELTAKKEFMDQYPDYPKAAGAVINIVEDQYIDWHRGRRFKGMRRARAFVIDAIMQNHHRRPRIDKLDAPQALLEGLLQVAFAGYAKGFSDADDEVREYLAWARDRVSEARRTEDADEREAIAHELTEKMLARFPDDADRDAIDEAIDDMPTDDVPSQPGIGDGPEPDDGDDAESAQDDADADQDQDAPDDGQDGSGSDQGSEQTIDVDSLLEDFDPDELAIVN